MKTLKDIISEGKMSQDCIYIDDLNKFAHNLIRNLKRKPKQVKKWEKEHKKLADKEDYSSCAWSASLSQFIYAWETNPIRLSKISLIKTIFNLEEEK